MATRTAAQKSNEMNSCPVSDIKSRGISFSSSSSSSSSSSFLSRIQKEKKKKKKKKEEEERTGNWNPFFPSLKRKKERKKVQKEKGKKINEKNTTKKIYIYIYIYIYIKRRRRRRVQRRPWTTLANTLTHRHTDTPTHWRRASQFRFIRPSFLHPFMSGCGIGPSPRQTNNKATTKQQQSNNKIWTDIDKHVWRQTKSKSIWKLDFHPCAILVLWSIAPIHRQFANIVSSINKFN